MTRVTEAEKSCFCYSGVLNLHVSNCTFIRTDVGLRFKNNVNCKGASQGIFLQGLPEMNFENIRLENIRMEADYGMICTDAKNVTVKNLTLITKKSPAINLRNSTDIQIDGLNFEQGLLPVIHISGAKTGNTVFKNAGLTNPDKQPVIEKEVAKERIQIVK